MDYNEIRQLIKSKKPDIDEQTLTYFTNYFFVVVKRNVLPENMSLDEAIENGLRFSKLKFYDETDNIYKDLGKDAKGLCDSKTKTIYVRNNLAEPLREIVVYHEIHHATQTNSATNEVGINQESNIGRLVMEGQTQYFAEEVYQEIHNERFPEREIASQDLRMASGGTVFSSLHNYEMYDNLLTKLAILLGVSKDYFVTINYQYQDGIGLRNLEEQYLQTKEKYNLPYDFYELLYYYDYVYCIDLLAYKDNPEKQVILNGETTKNQYEIYPKKGGYLSLGIEQGILSKTDGNLFLILAENGGNYKEFASYIVDDKTRAQALEYISLLNNEATGRKN